MTASAHPQAFAPQADDASRANAADGPGGKPDPGAGRRIPFLEKIGMRRTRAADGEALVEIALSPDLLNNHGAGHGGVVMTLLDSAMAHAALSGVGYAREVVTIDMHVGFLRPAVGALQVVGRAVGGGRSVCFCEAEARDASGEVVAKSMGTFRYRDLAAPAPETPPCT